MTDRELLELAAKAAGIKLHVWGTKGNENFADMDSQPYGKLWNPLTNDGDALRLAVELSLLPGGAAILLNSRLDSTGFVTVYTNSEVVVAQEYMLDDHYAATRRAIVRAAAEIGKAMP